MDVARVARLAFGGATIGAMPRAPCVALRPGGPGTDPGGGGAGSGAHAGSFVSRAERWDIGVP